MTKKLLPGVCALLMAAPAAPAPDALDVDTVRLINHFGSIQVSVLFETEMSIQAASPARPLLQGDTVATTEPGLLTIECKPRDGSTVDLDVGIPFGIKVAIETTSGAISLRGMFPKASLATVDGAIRVAAPWKATRLVMTSAAAPRTLDAAFDVSITRPRGSPQHPPRWELRDKPDAAQPAFGEIEIKAHHPGDVVLAEMPVPEQAPVRFPWQAREAIEKLLGISPPGQPRGQSGQGRAGAPPSGPSSSPGPEEFVFRSDVRMVNLTVSVTEPDGQPALDLLSDEFEISEDGVPQKIAAFNSDEAPFNLVLLLDLSDSTYVERGSMKEAARRFIGIARPADRVAVYALVNNRLVVISPLTSDRPKLLELLEQIPEVGSDSPLYDTIVLAYGYELHRHRGERNALLVITDGLDNGLRPRASRSKRFSTSACCGDCPKVCRPRPCSPN